MRFVDPDGRETIPFEVAKKINTVDRLYNIGTNIKKTDQAAGYKLYQVSNGNCCFARACLIAKELRDYGFNVSYVYTDPKKFDYHVAVAVTIDNERYVIDPSFQTKKGVFTYPEWVSMQEIQGNNPRPYKPQLIGNAFENYNIAINYKHYLQSTGKSMNDISIYEYSAKLIKHYHNTGEVKLDE